MTKADKSRRTGGAWPSGRCSFPKHFGAPCPLGSRQEYYCARAVFPPEGAPLLCTRGDAVRAWQLGEPPFYPYRETLVLFLSKWDCAQRHFGL